MGDVSEAVTRGVLRVYLGAAPGVGKTYAMLSEGLRRHARGTDVVVGLAEAHGRAPVLELLAGLEIVPPRVVETPRGPADQLDAAAVLARRPRVALVDDLARAVPGDAGGRPRWQSIEQLLDAGIDVVTTVNIDQLESLADVVEAITGRPPATAVADEVVRRADQIELVDMTPEALRRRMAHGNIYPAEQVDAALSHYFRVGNLAALRELALLWLADRVDEGLERYRTDHDIASTWATRERVLVALTGGPESDTLLRRGARLASRGAGGELHAVHVSSSKGTGPAAAELARLRALTEELGGTHHNVVGDDTSQAVLHLARALNVSHILLGASRRRRWLGMLIEGVSDRVIAGSGDIDVLVVTHPYARTGATARPRRRGALDRRRVLLGWMLALAGPLVLSAVLIPARDGPTLAVASMGFLALTVVCALVGGLFPAVGSALTSSLALNWFFTPPHHTLTIDDPVNVVSLVLFLVVAVAVASVVDTAARRSLQSSVARHEADSLTMLNRALLRGLREPRDLLALLRDTFGVESVALLRRHDRGWTEVASVGDDPPTDPAHASDTAALSGSLVLATGSAHPLPAHESTVLAAFATHLTVALDRQELERQAAEAQRLREGNRVRTALLAAVSHDLRTPLAGIKAAVSSLRSPGMAWSEADEAELLATIEEGTDRLHSILANLLDLSRLQTGAVQVTGQEIGLDDVVSRTVASMPQARAVELGFAEQLPLVRADAGLLDRVVENLVDNAVRHSGQDGRVSVRTSRMGQHVQLRVVDRGKGVEDIEKERMFRPFQRLDDSEARPGVGLGLAVARGLTEAMGGALTAEDTPGGGLTMVVDLPAADTHLDERQEVPS